MLISFGHGKIGYLGNGGALAGAVSEEFVEMPAAFRSFASAEPKPFGYMFDGDGLPEDGDAFTKLGKLGAAMITDTGDMMGPAEQAAILTYFGQFIDHDITLNTDRDPDDLTNFSVAPSDGELVRNSRERVLEVLVNGRSPTLQLDSVYGDGTDREAKLRNGPRMRIGETVNGRPFDLPRFAAIDPDAVRDNDEIFPSTAFIGDGRNDENLIIAQLHLAFLRFHNAMVDSLQAKDSGASEEQLFNQAREQTIFHYQWLVANVYLPAICDETALAQVWKAGAKRYREFSNGTGTMPLEFSLAGFRFGHSMIRPSYVFNDNFDEARLRTLFSFTGGKNSAFGGDNKLPDIWVIDWNNFIQEGDSARSARPTDSALAEGLDDLNTEQDLAALKSLPARNLRRSYVLNIPTAQSVLGGMTNYVDIDVLTDDELLSFSDRILDRLGYLENTPLWLYLLLEAELRAESKHLGELGTVVVAETLIGILWEDKTSILYNGGDKAASWTPVHSELAEEPINSFERFLQFAGVLAPGGAS